MTVNGKRHSADTVLRPWWEGRGLIHGCLLTRAALYLQKLQQGSAGALARSHVVYLAGTPSVRSEGCPVCGPTGLFLPENCTDREEGKREVPIPHGLSFSLECRIILWPSRESVHMRNLFRIYLVLRLLLLNIIYPSPV